MRPHSFFPWHPIGNTLECLVTAEAFGSQLPVPARRHGVWSCIRVGPLSPSGLCGRFSSMAPKARATNKAPRVVAKGVRVPLLAISTKRPDSGWRDPDPRRLTELADTFYAGQWGMHVFADICLLAATDMDGKRIVDDGLATITALLAMYVAFVEDADATPSREPWPANIVNIFEQGVPCTTHEYEEDTDLDLREAWNAAKHDEESNKFKKTPVATFISIATKCFGKHGANWTNASKALLDIYGAGRASSVYRWVRAARYLPRAVAAELANYPDISAAFIFDNYYLLGTGAHESQKLTPPYAIQALQMAQDDVSMGAKDFQEQICKPLKVVEAWSYLMIKRFGQVASKSKAFDRVVLSLRTPGGLRKVSAMCASGVVLHGTSTENPGIIECFRIVEEMQKCKAGGLPPPAVLPDATDAGATMPNTTDPDVGAPGGSTEFDQNAADALLAALGTGEDAGMTPVAEGQEKVEEDLRSVHFHTDWKDLAQAATPLIRIFFGAGLSWQCYEAL